MLHGIGGSVAHMRAEVDRLSEHFRVIAIDSRGHGRSERPAAYTLNDHVMDVFGVMDALGLDQTALMGTSMGSYVAQGVAVRAPHRITKLVLITPKAHGESSSVALFLARHAEAVRGMTPDEVRAFTLAGIVAPTTPARVLRSLAHIARQQKAAGLALTTEQEGSAQRALAGFDFRPNLPQVTAPTLVISGRYDPINPPEAGEEIARLIPDAQFQVLEYSGHLPTVEEPDRLLDLVESFLDA
jgi:3-oxoadipate enol-lactonase